VSARGRYVVDVELSVVWSLVAEVRGREFGCPKNLVWPGETAAWAVSEMLGLAQNGQFGASWLPSTLIAKLLDAVI